MLRSGNDAAVCLAEVTCGSISAFADKMNEKAKQLQLTNTHFDSPHGLDSDGHYTTAYELAILTDYALKNPTFAQIVGTQTATITINGYSKTLSNTNELLGNLDGVYGVKTGFTNGANRCLVTACKRGDMDIICVVLGCDTKKFRTQDSIKLIEYTLGSYEYVNIAEKISKELDIWKTNNLNSFLIEKGKKQSFDFSYKDLENSIIPVDKSAIDNIKINICINIHLSAPIYKNDKIGYITVTTNDKLILNCDIIANETVEKKGIFYYIFDFFKNYNTTFQNNLETLLSIT